MSPEAQRLLEQARQLTPDEQDWLAECLLIKDESVSAEIEAQNSRAVSALLQKIEKEVATLGSASRAIFAGADSILAAASQISAAARQVAAAAEQANAATREAASAATEQSRGAEDLAAAIEEIAALADELKQASA